MAEPISRVCSTTTETQARRRRVLTPEQRAAATERQRARRHAKKPPRIPMTPEEYRLKRVAVMRQRRARFREQFVGPSWPFGLRRDRAANQVRRESVETGRTELIGPPKPARAVLAATLQAERRSVADARRERERRTRAEAAKAKALGRVGREWDRAAVKIVSAVWKAIRREASRQRALEWQREYDRRKRMTDQERDAARAEREAARARLDALFAAQQAELRAKVAEAEAGREAQAATLAQRRAAALAAAEATAAKARTSASVARAQFTPPSRI